MVRAIKALRAEGVTVLDADEHRSSMVDHGAAGRCVLPHSPAWSHSKQLWLSIGAASRVLESHSTRCRVLYNPVCEKTRTDPQGREHIVRPHGLKQSSAPGRHVTMGRDKNAPANFVIRHQALVATGEVPWQFQRGTELEYPEARARLDCDQSLSSSRASPVQATRYKYRRDSVTGKLVRWVKPAAAG
jgi:hypothetical protein